MIKNIRIGWLGIVYDLGGYRIGRLICGPHNGAYTITTGSGIHHVPATNVVIQTVKDGPYTPGTSWS